MSGKASDFLRPKGEQGAAGATILSGIIDPVNGQGVDGDFYINTVSNEYFGPKVGGSWPVGVSMVGPPGTSGAQGPQGIQGPAGNDGNDGADGAQGPQGIQGPQGDAGTNGTNGTNGSDGNDGAPGAQGPQGIQGIQGNPGADGATGPQGIQGIQGATGAQGPAGVGSGGDIYARATIASNGSFTKSEGISTVTEVYSGGDPTYTQVTFTTTRADTNYQVLIGEDTESRSGDVQSFSITNKTTSSFRIAAIIGDTTNAHWGGGDLVVIGL